MYHNGLMKTSFLAEMTDYVIVINRYTLGIELNNIRLCQHSRVFEREL